MLAFKSHIKTHHDIHVSLTRPYNLQPWDIGNTAPKKSITVPECTENQEEELKVDAIVSYYKIGKLYHWLTHLKGTAAHDSQ